MSAGLTPRVRVITLSGTTIAMTRNPYLPLEPATTLIGVAVVTDDVTVRRDLSTLLATLDRVCMVERGDAHVVLRDLGVDDETVEKQLGGIREVSVPTVALVSASEQVPRALAAGARGALFRSKIGPEIADVISAIYSGLTVVDTMLARQLHSGPSQPIASIDRLGSELTGRELQVAQLLSQGLSNKLIADRLGISDHTAKFHVNGVMTKLNASTRTEAVVEALRRGLITL